MPLQGTGTEDDPIRPKYTDGFIYRSMPFNPDLCVVLVQATQTELNAISAQTDTMGLATPQTINDPLSAAQVSAAKTTLETLSIPAQFLTTGQSRRLLLRQLVGMIQFSQRMIGRFGKGWRQRAAEHGLTLDSTWSNFPQALKDEFIGVAESFGWDVPSLGLSASSTLREILNTMAEQFAGYPFVIGGIEI